MALSLSSPAPITTIVVGLSDPYGLPRISIHGVPVHSNLAQTIVYESPSTVYFNTGLNEN